MRNVCAPFLRVGTLAALAVSAALAHSPVVRPLASGLPRLEAIQQFGNGQLGNAQFDANAGTPWAHPQGLFAFRYPNGWQKNENLNSGPLQVVQVQATSQKAGALVYCAPQQGMTLEQFYQQVFEGVLKQQSGGNARFEQPQIKDVQGGKMLFGSATVGQQAQFKCALLEPTGAPLRFGVTLIAFAGVTQEEVQGLNLVFGSFRMGSPTGGGQPPAGGGGGGQPPAGGGGGQPPAGGGGGAGGVGDVLGGGGGGQPPAGGGGGGGAPAAGGVYRHPAGLYQLNYPTAWKPSDKQINDQIHMMSAVAPSGKVTVMVFTGPGSVPVRDFYNAVFAKPMKDTVGDKAQFSEPQVKEAGDGTTCFGQAKGEGMFHRCLVLQPKGGPNTFALVFLVWPGAQQAEVAALDKVGLNLGRRN